MACKEGTQGLGFFITGILSGIIRGLPIVQQMRVSRNEIVQGSIMYVYFLATRFAFVGWAVWSRQVSSRPFQYDGLVCIRKLIPYLLPIWGHAFPLFNLHQDTVCAQLTASMSIGHKCHGVAVNVMVGLISTEKLEGVILPIIDSKILHVHGAVSFTQGLGEGRVSLCTLRQ